MKIACDCSYCLEYTFIWEINSMVWIEIPKNGSHNLKHFRFKNKLNLINSNQINNYKRGFLILRDPIERFRSLLSFYFINNVVPIITDKIYPNINPPRYLGGSWLYNLKTNHKNICDIVLDNFKFISKIEDAHHFSSQKSFIPNEFYNLNFTVYNLKEMNLFFGMEKKVNTTNTSSIYISKSNEQKIKDLYSDDVELYEKYLI